MGIDRRSGVGGGESGDRKEEWGGRGREWGWSGGVGWEGVGIGRRSELGGGESGNRQEVGGRESGDRVGWEGERAEIDRSGVERGESGDRRKSWWERERVGIDRRKSEWERDRVGIGVG